jgi:hypothetical protein
MTKVKYSLFIGLVCLMVVTHAFAWMINENYKQLDGRGATDFEILLQGDISGQVTGGGFSCVTNPFADPNRSMPKDPYGNTIVRFDGSSSIPKSDTNNHFGIYGDGKKPRVLVKAWSFASAPTRVPVPKSNFDFLYDSASRTLQIIVENTSPDTVTFQDVGFLLGHVERPIEDLNQTTLPPGAFDPLPELNHEYSPGDSNSVTISGVEPSAYVITYGTVFFSGPSAGNDYNSTGGEWAEVAVIDQVPEAIPTVSEWGLVIMVLLLLGAGTIVLTRCRRTALMAIVIGLFMTLGHTTLTKANVFVLPLVEVPGDSRPFIQIDGRTVLIDSGAMCGLMLTQADAAALGVNPATGVPGAAGGIGGTANTITGCTTPGGIGPSGQSTPVIPEGQAATTPPMPTTTTILTAPPGMYSMLGSEWLKQFFCEWGQCDGYYYLVAKDQGAEGSAIANAMAAFLGLSPAVTLDSNGQPQGTKHKYVQPTPPREGALDGGFDIEIDIENPPIGGTHHAPLIIKSSLPMSLITQSLALDLGLDLSKLKKVETLGNFGPIEVLQADLELRLFDDPGFPTFTVPVGITDPNTNPFGDNFLGGDILGKLQYWEISQDQEGVTRFYAYAGQTIPTVTEWGLIIMALLLLTAGAIVIVRRRRVAA